KVFEASGRPGRSLGFRLRSRGLLWSRWLFWSGGLHQLAPGEVVVDDGPIRPPPARDAVHGVAAQLSTPGERSLGLARLHRLPDDRAVFFFGEGVIGRGKPLRLKERRGEPSLLETDPILGRGLGSGVRQLDLPLSSVQG